MCGLVLWEAAPVAGSQSQRDSFGAGKVVTSLELVPNAARSIVPLFSTYVPLFPDLKVFF